MRPDSLSDRRLLHIALLLSHVAVVAGLYLLFRIGRPRVFAYGLALITSILLIDLGLLLEFNAKFWSRSAGISDRVSTIKTLPIWQYLGDGYVLGTLLLLSVAGAVVVGTLAFYLVITLFFTFLIARIYLRDYGTRTVGFDLLFITAGSLAILLVQTLSVAYYVGSPDTVNHSAAILEIVRTQKIDSISDTRYYAYPVYHVLSAMGTLLTDSSPRVYTAIEIGVLFQFGLVAIYSLVRRLTGSQTLGLMSATLVAFNFSFISFGTRSHYQSLSFVFAAIFIYILFKPTRFRRETFLGLVILAAWTLTHHVSILMVLIIFGPGVIAWYILSDAQETQVKPIRVYTMLGVIFFTYYAIITARFGETITWVLSRSAASQGVPSTSYLATVYDSVEQLLLASWPFLIDSLHFALSLSLVLVGSWVVVMRIKAHRRRWLFMFLSVLPAIVFYYPNPAWLLFEGLIELDRWWLMVLPFVAILPAIGIKAVVDDAYTTFNSHFNPKAMLVWIFLFLMVFVSITSGMSNPGLTDIVAGAEKDAQQHLTEDQLQAAEFTMANAAEGPVYTHAYLASYMSSYSNARGLTGPTTTTERIQASVTQQRLLVRPGLTLFPVESFRTQGFRVQMTDFTDESPYQGEDDVEVYDVALPGEFKWIKSDGSRVYTNGGTVLKYKPSQNETG